MSKTNVAMWYGIPKQMDTQARHQIVMIPGSKHQGCPQMPCIAKDVADLLGITNRDVSRWENGKVEPGLKYRLQLADELRRDVSRGCNS